jgi:hypothetical protein
MTEGSKVFSSMRTNAGMLEDPPVRSTRLTVSGLTAAMSSALKIASSTVFRAPGDTGPYRHDLPEAAA